MHTMLFYTLLKEVSLVTNIVWKSEKFVTLTLIIGIAFLLFGLISPLIEVKGPKETLTMFGYQNELALIIYLSIIFAIASIFIQRRSFLLKLLSAILSSIFLLITVIASLAFIKGAFPIPGYSAHLSYGIYISGFGVGLLWLSTILTAGKGRTER